MMKEKEQRNPFAGFNQLIDSGVGKVLVLMWAFFVLFLVISPLLGVGEYKAWQEWIPHGVLLTAIVLAKLTSRWEHETERPERIRLVFVLFELSVFVLGIIYVDYRFGPVLR